MRALISSYILNLAWTHERTAAGKHNAYPLDKLEKLQARRIQQIVSWHRVYHNVDNGLQQMMLYQLSIVEFILHTDT